MIENTTNELATPVTSSEVQPPLASEQVEQIRQGFAALQSALDQDPGLPEELEALFRDHLRKGPTTNTIYALYAAVALYVADGGVDGLFAVLTRSDDSRYADAARSQATAQAWACLRRLLALYGSEMREAYALSGENLGAWRELNRRVNYDAVSGKWSVSLEIVKYSGERLTLEETPNSALSLVIGIMDTLGSAPAQMAPDLVPVDSVEKLLRQCVALVDLYAPGKRQGWCQAIDQESKEYATEG